MTTAPIQDPADDVLAPPSPCTNQAMRCFMSSYHSSIGLGFGLTRLAYERPQRHEGQNSLSIPTKYGPPQRR